MSKGKGLNIFPDIRHYEKRPTLLWGKCFLLLRFNLHRVKVQAMRPYGRGGKNLQAISPQQLVGFRLSQSLTTQLPLKKTRTRGLDLKQFSPSSGNLGLANSIASRAVAGLKPDSKINGLAVS